MSNPSINTEAFQRQQVAIERHEEIQFAERHTPQDAYCWSCEAPGHRLYCPECAWEQDREALRAQIDAAANHAFETDPRHVAHLLGKLMKRVDALEEKLGESNASV